MLIKLKNVLDIYKTYTIVYEKKQAANKYLKNMYLKNVKHVRLCTPILATIVKMKGVSPTSVSTMLQKRLHS